MQQVLRIKHLLLVDGLTLAGARRRISEETMPAEGESPAIDELIGQNARERLAAVKRGLRSILDLLAGAGGGDDFELAPPVAAPARARPTPAARAKPSRGKEPPARRTAARSPQARRNRSA